MFAQDWTHLTPLYLASCLPSLASMLRQESGGLLNMTCWFTPPCQSAGSWTAHPCKTLLIFHIQLVCYLLDSSIWNDMILPSPHLIADTNTQQKSVYSSRVTAYWVQPWCRHHVQYVQGMSSQWSMKYKLWLYHFAEVKEFFQILRTDTDWSQLHDSRNWLLTLCTYTTQNPTLGRYYPQVDCSMSELCIREGKGWVFSSLNPCANTPWNAYVNDLITYNKNYPGGLYSFLVAAVTKYHNLVAQTHKFIILQF